MILDPRLARARFDRDTNDFRRSPDVYKAAGVLIKDIAYPRVCADVYWPHRQSYLHLVVEAIDYDYRPATGWWIDDAGRPLQVGSGLIPANNGFQPSSAPSSPNSPLRPWFCFPGWSDYHDHSGHQNVPWGTLRGETQYRLPAIILQLAADLRKVTVAQ